HVLQHDLKLRRRSRIWLCPTAAFTFIPLHAAHPFRMKADRSGRELYLEDIYIYSYTPTLSALMRSRRAMKTCHPRYSRRLDSANLVQGKARFSPLSIASSSLSVNSFLPMSNSLVHLACHGKQDRNQPYHSRFAMREKPLTLLDITENHAPQAEFAFLSACHTAIGDEETPDEVIHLAAGLQFSGFKSVVGTLWVVDDAFAKHVIEAFYEKMFEDSEDGVIYCTKAARVLNHATDVVRKKVPLEQRIVFIHIGV
ncbi:CHAT domain-containing protein, partial [Suillus cothurnatus]